MLTDRVARQRLEARIRELQQETTNATSRALLDARDHEEELSDRHRTIALQDARVTTLEAALARMREERDATRDQLAEALRRARAAPFAPIDAVKKQSRLPARAFAGGGAERDGP